MTHGIRVYPMLGLAAAAVVLASACDAASTSPPRPVRAAAKARPNPSTDGQRHAAAFRLYHEMELQHRPQHEIDAALGARFGLRRVGGVTTDSAVRPAALSKPAVPGTDAGDITLQAPSFYYDREGLDSTWEVFAGFSCSTDPCFLSDPKGFADSFGLAFNGPVTVVNPSFATYDVVGDTTNNVPGPQKKDDYGIAYTGNSNGFWKSGFFSAELKFPDSCPASGRWEANSFYSHGWSNNQITSETFTIGLPATVSVAITYSNVPQSWQIVSANAGTRPCGPPN